jgi:energy-converting hydrogenase Eha subunit E
MAFRSFHWRDIDGGFIMQEDIDTKIEAARIGAAAVGVTLYGLTLNEIVALVTLIYLGAQIIILMPKVFNIIRGLFK